MDKVIFALSLLVLTSCVDASKIKHIGRFEYVSDFVMFDSPKPNPTRGEIIKDRTTGHCYLVLWFGQGNGGPAMVRHDCQLD